MSIFIENGNWNLDANFPISNFCFARGIFISGLWFLLLVTRRKPGMNKDQKVMKTNHSEYKWTAVMDSFFAFVGCLLLRASTLFKQKVHRWEGIDEIFLHPPKEYTNIFLYIHCDWFSLPSGLCSSRLSLT